MVGVPAGGSADMVARLLAEKLQTSLGETVIVENRPSASARQAVNEVKNSTPDGSTLYVGPNSPFSVLPHVYGDAVGYDPVRDFTPIIRLTRLDLGLASGPAVPAKNITEALAWARNNPSKATYGTSGAGTISHFLGVMIAKATGIPFVHVPYKGGAAATTDLLGGHVSFMIASIADQVAPHKADKLHVLANLGQKRSPLLPEVPTLKEAGIEGIAADLAIDVYAAAKTPPAIVSRLNAAFSAAINEPDIQKKIVTYGLFPAPSTPEELRAFQHAEFEMWKEPIKASGFAGD